VNRTTVVEFDPRRGRAEPLADLSQSPGMWDSRGSGRYLPARSGVLAYYRDAAGRRILQHRRRRVAIPDGTRVHVRSVLAVRIVRVDGRVGFVAIDFPMRWAGPLWLQFFDYTWLLEEDFDLLEAVQSAADGKTPDWI